MPTKARARKERRSPRAEGLLRIGELARRAGVARGTIQHYLREGLLPKPVKTHRNMAYYPPDCIERIRLIKELQTRSYLPLSEIRHLIGTTGRGSTLAQAVVHAQESALAAISPAARSGALSPAEAAAQFELRATVLEELVSLSVVSVKCNERGEHVFTGVDLEVLAAIAKLRQLGFSDRAGFKASELCMYRDALAGLLQRELQSFVRVLASRRGAKMTTELARCAMDGATMLLLALRKKSIVDLLANIESELPGMRAGA